MCDDKDCQQGKSTRRQHVLLKEMPSTQHILNAEKKKKKKKKYKYKEIKKKKNS
jgi:hypothetical protein